MENLSKGDLYYYDHKNSKELKGCLYIIATPIGNYEDISLRAINVLSLVDILLCEDTRKSKKLLSHLKIKCRNLISYNDKNAEKKRPYILKQLLLNKNIGLVCDAGTPLISDPGYKIVQECYQENIKVTHLPGPSSVINALVLSGLPTNQFFFGGFLSSKKSGKEKQLLTTKYNTMTGIWFDTCLRLQNTLKIMLDVYGNRKVSIARELTKTYEDIIISDLVNIDIIISKRNDNNKPLKGEVVIIISGYESNSNVSTEELNINIKNKLKHHTLRDAVNLVIEETNLSKKQVYNEAIKIKNKL
ncbi:16S rRNA (cytidine(1402)-2'-O)-methyltransferase [Alphaproteobacteria bacterium]|nr:16S rRNA (cytidine(1402)-2'-O)-methyltransferase [Alphaproteobacteria bacterium]